MPRAAPIACLLLVLDAAVAGCGGAQRDPALASQAPARARSGRAGQTSATPVVLSAGDWRAAYTDRAPIEVRQGQVSYYSDRLAGRSTASGEPYDPREYTAASRDLPFGTVVRVVRIDTGASVIVRINDRGPFGSRRRILDLSRAAAEALDMIRRGVVEVRAEILERGPGRRTR